MEIEMEEPIYADEENADDEVRRQLGWYLVPQNNDIVELDD
jgi:hypothetical protein